MSDESDVDISGDEESGSDDDLIYDGTNFGGIRGIRGIRVIY